MRTLRAALAADVAPLIARLATKDRQELEFWCAAPVEAMEMLVRLSTVAYCGLDDVGPAMIGGVRGVMGDRGALWVMASPAAAAHPYWLARSLRSGIAEAKAYHPVIVGVTDDRYPRTMRLMRWLGFTYLPPITIAGRVLHPMELRQ